MSEPRTLQVISAGIEAGITGNEANNWCQSCVYQGFEYRCAGCNHVVNERDMTAVHLCSGALLICNKCNA